jgi:hypothetical protein
MSETAQQLCTPLDPRIPERAESTSAMEDEACLTVEILQYWDAHLHYQGPMKETNQKAREVHQHLGKLLFHLKQVLAKPGRGGKWSSFLKEHRIPRATADRLVTRYQHSLDPDANRLTEATSEPTEEEVQKLFNAVWPRLRRVLTTPGSVYRFVSALASACADACFEVRDDGILVLKPAAENTDSRPRDDADPKADSHAEVTPTELSKAASPTTKHPIASLPLDPEFEDEPTPEPCGHDGIGEGVFVECL